MSYDQYRGIRFKQERALWRGDGLPFQVGFYPRGFLYREGVEIHTVRDGISTRVLYSEDLFDFDDPEVRVGDDLGFAGFRIHAATNAPGEFEEFCVFLGASYFRAVGRGQLYGLSARGLGIGTGRIAPEEFPTFRSFWIQRPQQGVGTLVIHALLDSPSTTGSFRFTIRPGEMTVMDVESVLFPRVDIVEVGIAPLTSMYQFGVNDRGDPASGRADDWRSAVHDSDGLAVLTGRGERLWRPLINPVAVQFSAFMDSNPRGYGLMQRKRGFNDYGDLQVLYGRRPSLWVEPFGDWGTGAIDLVEIPTRTEHNDNIVAFWRGGELLAAGREYSFTYRLHWGADAPPGRPLARTAEMRTGAGMRAGTRVFVLDLAGELIPSLPGGADTRLELACSNGRIREGYSGPIPETGGWRVSIDFDPEGQLSSDLRCVLRGAQGALS